MQLDAVPRRFAGERVVVAATGPSLAPEVAEQLRGEIVIAVSDAWRLIPWASVLYSCDRAWWDAHLGAFGFVGEKWTSHSLKPANDKTEIASRYELHVVAGARRPGFSFDPAVIHYGHNSGFQAVNLAILMGAVRIVLVGFDMRPVGGRAHFFGDHPRPLKRPGPFAAWISAFHAAAAGLPPGIRIINATPGSALDCFERMELSAALRMEPLAA